MKSILWHSVKYPPKKDGMYYYSNVLPSGRIAIYTLDFTTDGGWCTFRYSNGEVSKGNWTIDDGDMWAEVQSND